MSAAAALFTGVTAPGPVAADDAIDAWARWAVTPKVWKGQVVLAPVPAPRPALELELQSLEHPLRVHAPPGRRRAAAVLAALERAYRGWVADEWPLPVPDSGRGGSSAFDLYVVPGLPASEARVDALVVPSDFDAAHTFALVPADVSGAQRAACVQSAFAQAALRALEPAEAAIWVRATAEWSVWQETGEPGCEFSLVVAQQQPERSMLGSDLAAAGSGALWLAMLSERHGSGRGDFVRALWELARQRSKGLVPDDQLRGSPDVGEVIADVLESAGEHWSDSVEELGVARYFAGEPQRRKAAAYRVFASLPPDASVPLLADVDVGKLPARVRTAADGGIEPLGSAYVRVRLDGDRGCRADGCELRVWLRGELGPKWSLTALRLSADGRELGRTRAPAREVPESFLPLAIPPETAELVLVITHLPRTLPDADLGPGGAHGVEITIDRAR